jgi:hypothetical protein
MGTRLLWLVVLLCRVSAGGLADEYRLTARPWKPLHTAPERYLEVIEGVCRFSIQHQNPQGAIIDPFLHREHQYATPYFAYAVGTLLEAGRARDLLPNGVRAMDHATACFGDGRQAIPDQHGEFFIAALTGALALYEHHVPREQWEAWRERLKKPVQEVVRGNTNNWETYVMKGEWMRAGAGLVSREGATAIIEAAWRERHRARIAASPWFLYHDRTSDPDTLSVEAVGRGNLLALTHLGYDGPSSAEIRRITEAATELTLRLADPSGQVPANGRTDDHTWVETGYQLAFDVMAERARARGDTDLAGQFRRAALLAFESIQRWRRADPGWAGSFFVTKNHFDPALRVGYQDASEYSNYNGSLMFHLSEAYHARQSAIAERPAPAEVGGYAFALDDQFATAFANAGGMLVQANLRGQVGSSSGNYWTPLGVVRFARPGWETRLGPSDGALTAAGGVSFAPTFMEGGRWVRMADLSSRYQAAWSVDFVHPLLVRCALTYAPKPGQAGPVFRNDLTITPDAVLSEVREISGGSAAWGVTWPVLESDGTALQAQYHASVAAVRYPGGSDEQNFIALDRDASLAAGDAPLRSTYGDLRAVRMTTKDTVSRTLVYPRSEGDPSAEEVRRTFTRQPDGFRSAVGTVKGDLYIGRTAAGGVGREIDLNRDGRPEVTFSETCGFVLQLRKGAVVAMEADRDVDANLRGKAILLKRHQPVLSP